MYVLLSSTFAGAAAECQIDLDHPNIVKSKRKGMFPLIVDGNGNFIYPVAGRVLRFSEG